MPGATYLREKYNSILPALSEELGLKNMHAVPRIKKVVVNASVGRLVVAKGEKALEPIIQDLARICGQQPSLRRARKAIAAFKVRQGLPMGVRVTLRGRRAEDFVARLIVMALPRLRDFRGIPSSALDTYGNLTVGVREQTAFPEAAENASGTIFGFEATIVTTAKNRGDAEIFFRKLGVPLERADQ